MELIEIIYIWFRLKSLIDKLIIRRKRRRNEIMKKFSKWKKWEKSWTLNSRRFWLFHEGVQRECSSIGINRLTMRSLLRWRWGFLSIQSVSSTNFEASSWNKRRRECKLHFTCKSMQLVQIKELCYQISSQFQPPHPSQPSKTHTHKHSREFHLGEDKKYFCVFSNENREGMKSS